MKKNKDATKNEEVKVEDVCKQAIADINTSLEEVNHKTAVTITKNVQTLVSVIQLLIDKVSEITKKEVPEEVKETK